jgi:molecular chaperone DnaK
MTKLIDKNTTVPTKASQVFSTADDNQTAVTIHVLQGERQRATDNKSLGRFDLAGISSAPRGTPQIEVMFNIDANGILNVSAKDKATGKAQSIIIKASSGLSEDEIQRMVKDAEAHKEEDRKFQELVGVRNQADAQIHTVSKTLEAAGDKISAQDKASIETAMADLKEALKTDDKAMIEAKNTALSEVSAKLSAHAQPQEGEQASYGGQAGEGSSGEGPQQSEHASQKPDDNVVDAEFEEIKDKDKDKNKK